ncbi:MAG: hypothetical protein HQM13_11215 [SAR324 cluster bacterium]|nr:hypothetical protein [SAR324 cluster bacterium]
MTQNKNRPDKLTKLIDEMEEAYEFMLAYAAQGRQGNEDSGTEEIRTFLKQADTALAGLLAASSASVEKQGLSSTASFQNFFSVLEQDIKKSQTIIQLVLDQSCISSLMVDNLNGSIHLRALLTDLFLIDEILKAQVQN